MFSLIICQTCGLLSFLERRCGSSSYRGRAPREGVLVSTQYKERQLLVCANNQTRTSLKKATAFKRWFLEVMIEGAQRPDGCEERVFTPRCPPAACQSLHQRALEALSNSHTLGLGCFRRTCTKRANLSQESDQKLLFA